MQTHFVTETTCTLIHSSHPGPDPALRCCSKQERERCFDLPCLVAFLVSVLFGHPGDTWVITPNIGEHLVCDALASNIPGLYDTLASSSLIFHKEGEVQRA